MHNYSLTVVTGIAFLLKRCSIIRLFLQIRLKIICFYIIFIVHIYITVIRL